MLDCEKVNIGEQLVKDYLREQGYDVIDCTKDSNYWTQDIDFIAIKGKERITIEVKYDAWINRTHNIFAELMSDIDKAKCGWVDFCKADYLYYVDAVSKRCYIFTLTSLREYIATQTYSIKYCYDRNSQGQVYKRSSGALINIDSFASQFDVEIIELGA